MDVRVKKSRFRPVVGGVLLQHFLSVRCRFKIFFYLMLFYVDWNVVKYGAILEAEIWNVGSFTFILNQQWFTYVILWCDFNSWVYFGVMFQKDVKRFHWLSCNILIKRQKIKKNVFTKIEPVPQISNDWNNVSLFWGNCWVMQYFWCTDENTIFVLILICVLSCPFACAYERKI